jgi:hypothetical protein
MANQNGKKYGFTALFPIRAGDHAAELRSHLRGLDRTFYGSPLSEVRAIHMARFVVIDRLAYQGLPAKADTLASSYMLFLCDFDGESPDALVAGLAAAIPDEVEEIWQHCVAFPGVGLRDPLTAYFEQCQIETNLFLADRPQDTVDDILKSLTYRKKFTELTLWLQKQAAPAPAELKRRLTAMRATIEDGPAPHPGSL